VSFLKEGSMTKKEARVLVVEEDPYARDFIALLLARDWRTRVIGEVGSMTEMRSYFPNHPNANINMVLLSTELLEMERSPSHWKSELSSLPGKPHVMLFGSHLNAALARFIPFENFCGCLLKQEIHYALAWAVAYALDGCWTITPGVEPWIRHAVSDGEKTRHLRVMDGRHTNMHLTESESEYARLAFVFSMERPEVSHEKNVSINWGYGKISELYHKLGLDEILSGPDASVERLGKQFTQIPRFQQILKHAIKTRKKKDLETLAFHVLSMPDIEEPG
jgi:hypothetical protein